MRRLWFPVLAVFALSSTQRAFAQQTIPDIGDVGKITKVASETQSAGALAADYEGNVYVADAKAKNIRKIDLKGKSSIVATVEETVGGMAYDPRGKLVLCLPDAKKVISIDVKTQKRTVLAESFEGKPLKRPFGITADSQGGVYFCDLDANQLYYISKDKKIRRVVDEYLAAPKGVLLAPNGKTLYVYFDQMPIIMAYPQDPKKPAQDPGKVKGEVFCTLQQPQELRFGGGFGFTTDRKGNVFFATASGVQVFNPDGEYLDTIKTKQPPYDCVFGGEKGDMLYFSTGTDLHKTVIQIPFDYYPVVLLVIGIFLVFLFILYLRFHAFLALILAALIIGFLSPRVMLQAGDSSTLLQLVQVPQLVAFSFGSIMGRIGLAIAFATIIGKALMDSGAADRIVRFFTGLFGERMAPLALLASGFILSIPVFFDNVFLLLVPLARALHIRTGKNYLLYVIAIGAGGAVTHSLVPPTPGPIVMSDFLHVDLGYTIMMGTLVGIPVALVGFGYAAFANAKWPAEMRETAGVSVAELEQQSKVDLKDLPSLGMSLLPILLPVLFITSRTVFSTLVIGNPDLNQAIALGAVSIKPLDILIFLGEPSIALLIAALLSMMMVARQKRLSRESMKEFTVKALDDAGMILLITSAGGAFGAMLREVGVGQSLGALADMFDIEILVLAWGLAVLFKVAQGSGTVAMITAAQIIMGIVAAKLQVAYPGEEITSELMGRYLGYHPVYLVMAIGVGSKIASWMNDSGFWVVSRMGGLTETETVRSWTMCLVSMGIVGLPLVWGLSKILPLV